MVLTQSNRFHYRFECTLKDQTTVIRLIKCCNGLEEEIAHQPFAAERIYLKVVGRGQDYSFYYGSSEPAETILAEHVDGRILSTDVAGGFVGTYIGVFAGSNGETSLNHADFDWFDYYGQASS